jgi:hypothetical protein
MAPIIDLRSRQNDQVEFDVIEMNQITPTIENPLPAEHHIQINEPNQSEQNEMVETGNMHYVNLHLVPQDCNNPRLLLLQWHNDCVRYAGLTSSHAQKVSLYSNIIHIVSMVLSGLITLAGALEAAFVGFNYFVIVGGSVLLILLNIQKYLSFDVVKSKYMSCSLNFTNLSNDILRYLALIDTNKVTTSSEYLIYVEKNINLFLNDCPTGIK